MDKSELIVENKPIYSRLIYSAVFFYFFIRISFATKPTVTTWGADAKKNSVVFQHRPTTRRQQLSNGCLIKDILKLQYY